MRRLAPYLLLAPALLAIAAVIVYPMGYSMALSLYDLHLLRPNSGVFVGLENFGKVLGGAPFWETLWITARYATGSVILSFLLGMFTALLLNIDFRFRGIARAAIVIPWATPWLVTTLIWYVMFNPQIGPLNELLKRMGAIKQGVAWLYQNDTAMIAIIIVTAWRLFPSATLLILAGLQSISNELYEAAAVDGANWWARFRHITMPGLRSVNFVVLVILTITCFKLYTVAFVLTPGVASTRVLSVYIYEEAFKFNRLGTASTLATLSFLISAGLVLVYFRMLRGQKADSVA